jgi:hypothetical protein
MRGALVTAAGLVFMTSAAILASGVSVSVDTVSRSASVWSPIQIVPLASAELSPARFARSPPAPTGSVSVHNRGSVAAAHTRQGPEKPNKTLARQAVDALAEGRVQAAIIHYGALARARPHCPAYARAARILRRSARSK